MNEHLLRQIRQRCEDATPGPWEAGVNPTGRFSNSYVVRPEGEFPHGEWIADVGDRHDDERVANGAFIAHARMDVPTLLAEVERLQARIAELEAAARPVPEEAE